MDVWVRSQDKEKLCNIYQVYYESWSLNKQHHTIRCKTHELGEYPTKERCLEIIDEIQELLMGSQMLIFKDLDITQKDMEYLKPFKGVVYKIGNEPNVTLNQLDTVVYEMPQE